MRAAKNHAALGAADLGENEVNSAYMGQCCLHARHEMRAVRVTAHFQVSADSLHPLPDSRRHPKENKKPHKIEVVVLRFLSKNHYMQS